MKLHNLLKTEVTGDTLFTIRALVAEALSQVKLQTQNVLQIQIKTYIAP